MGLAADEDFPEPPRLRRLRRLVTVLLVTLIVGIITIVALLAIRLAGASPPLPLPPEIRLPAGETAGAVTLGGDWLAVVTVDAAGRERIRVLDRATGASAARRDRAAAVTTDARIHASQRSRFRFERVTAPSRLGADLESIGSEFLPKCRIIANQCQFAASPCQAGTAAHDIPAMSLPPGFLDELRGRVSLAQIVGRRVSLGPPQEQRRPRRLVGALPVPSGKIRVIPCG